MLVLAAASARTGGAQEALNTRLAWSSSCGNVATSGHITFDPSGAVMATVVRTVAGAAGVRTKWTGHAATIKAPQTVCSPAAPVYQLLLHGSFRGAEQQAPSAPIQQTHIEDAGAIPLTFQRADDAERAYREIRCLLLPARCVH